MWDILIKNANIVDGTGEKGAFRSDIAIKNGKISEIGLNLPLKAKKIVDAKEHIVCPGFIDMHSHADFSLPLLSTEDSLIKQGITTTITGQCGCGPLPLNDLTRPSYTSQVVKILECGDIPEYPWNEWDDLESYINYIEKKGMSINMATHIGHGSVRWATMGCDNSRPSTEQLNTMKTMVKDAVEQGAIGLSSGLAYVPNIYADIDEAVVLAKTAGGIYSSHIRNEANTCVEAVEEFLEIAKRAQVKCHMSHGKQLGPANWHKFDEIVALFENANEQGLDATLDVYPYVHSGNGPVGILSTVYPDLSYKKIAEKLRDLGERENVIKIMKERGFFAVKNWEESIIRYSPIHPEDVGQKLYQAAEKSGKAPEEWMLDGLAESNLELTVAIPVISEENLRNALKHPLVMLGSDSYGVADYGVLSKGQPHPRNYGTYPHFFEKYVREEKLLSIEQAVYKCTGMAAKKLGMQDRGTLKQGNKADIVIFDINTIKNCATATNPHKYPEGIDLVMVNGEVVVENGVHNGAKTGVMIKRQDLNL